MIFSDKTLACSNDCAPKHRDTFEIYFQNLVKYTNCFTNLLPRVWKFSFEENIVLQIFIIYAPSLSNVYQVSSFIGRLGQWTWYVKRVKRTVQKKIDILQLSTALKVWYTCRHIEQKIQTMTSLSLNWESLWKKHRLLKFA